MASSTDIIYHEKQVAGLCGVHAINNLLQGKYFTEIDLMTIAHELDASERAAMLEAAGGEDSPEYIRFLAEESGNVANDGNFSIQVLTKALDVWGLSLLSAGTREGKALLKDATSASGYLCNLQEHWLALRPVGNFWWNLNSLSPQPEQVSPTYLHLLLETLQSSGYSVFIVQGKLPACSGDGYRFADTTGKNNTSRTTGGTGGDQQFDADLAAAIEASLSQGDPTAAQGPAAGSAGGYRLGVTPLASEQGTGAEDADLQAAIALSLAADNNNSNNNNNNTATTPTDHTTTTTTPLSIPPPPDAKPCVVCGKHVGGGNHDLHELACLRSTHECGKCGETMAGRAYVRHKCGE